jgi:16S rRNA (cytidine1402-2'-O)-methyltransferase
MSNNLLQEAGELYIVSTPIGNLDDFTCRAVKICKKVDLIVAENCLHSKKLLKHFNIESKPMISLNLYNENLRANTIIEKIYIEKKNVALLSNAGTPLIQDPGSIFIRMAIAKGIKVITIPGPCAAISALTLSGMSANGFVFIGFLPAKMKSKSDVLHELNKEKRTIIIYEAPHRLLATINIMQNIFSIDRKIALVKEMTKIHEKVYRGSFQDIVNVVHKEDFNKKGEWVIIIEGNTEARDIQSGLKEQMKLAMQFLSIKDAAALLSQIRAIPKNKIYNIGKELKLKGR